MNKAATSTQGALAVDSMASDQLEALQHFAELGRISASLLHEISNPLTAAILQLDQYADNPLPGVRQAQRSLELLRRYVDAARQQIRQQDQAVSFSVRPQFDQLKRVLMPLAKASGAQLIIETIPQCRVRGDAVKFQQILANLIVNAIESYQHDVTDNLQRPVRVQFAISQKLLTVRVIDWGEGIASEQLAHIFEPFYSTKQPSSGHGLGIGLAIVQQYILRDFNGSIMVRSSRRSGTQFTIKLPLA